MLHDYLISLIRTMVPVGVGAALAWLAAKAGIVLDGESSAALTTAVVGVTIGGYYAVVRALEAHWPTAGWLLGKRSAPTYNLKIGDPLKAPDPPGRSATRR